MHNNLIPATNLFSKHKGDNFKHVHTELSFFIRTGYVQQHILQTTNMHDPVKKKYILIIIIISI